MESNQSRFDRYSVRNRVLNISHITFRDCRVHIFPDNLSRNLFFTLLVTCDQGTFFFFLTRENFFFPRRNKKNSPDRRLPCLMCKRFEKSEAILALLDSFQCISNGKPE